MWKETIAFIKSAVSSYKRLTHAEQDVKNIQDRVGRHDDEMDDVKKSLIRTLFEFEKVRMQMESDKQLAEHKYENLVLRLENAMLKNTLPALPPGNATPPSEIAELRARIESLEKENESIKTRLHAVENAVL